MTLEAVICVFILAFIDKASFTFVIVTSYPIQQWSGNNIVLLLSGKSCKVQKFLSQKVKIWQRNVREKPSDFRLNEHMNTVSASMSYGTTFLLFVSKVWYWVRS